MYFALTFRLSKATEQEEKVYGHLGIVNEIAKQEGIDPARIEPSYS